ncbi:hypothetical protein [Rosistilla oblonga]|uniref:hypothetical protein n=1 Tax=Rosistilla oblonga TaxID=2527990 RepID=UPI003A98278D
MRAVAIVVVTSLIGYRFALCAVIDTGRLFGWLIGASKSPIASSVAPLVFGLLGSAVIATIFKLATAADGLVVVKEILPNSQLPPDAIRQAVRDSWRRVAVQCVFAILLLNLTSEFVYQTRLGIHHGTAVRSHAEEPVTGKGSVQDVSISNSTTAD